MHPFIRAFVVGVVALGALIFNAGDIADPWHPWSSFGFTNDTAGVITAVDGYARSRGLRAGDAIDLPRLTFADRTQLGESPSEYEGRSIALPLRSGRTVQLVSHVRWRTLAENVTDVAAVLSLIAYTLIAAALVLLRPLPATWAFFLFSAAFLYNGNQDLQYFPPWLEVPLAFVFPALLQAVSPIAFYSFGLRFPNAQPGPLERRIEQVMLFGIAPGLMLVNLCSFTGVLSGVAFPQTITSCVQIAIAALYLPGIFSLISRYAKSAEHERTRLRWVVAAFAIGFLPYVCFTAAQIITASVISLAAANVGQAWLVIAPAALAYTVLKHRLFDIRFVVSRALIFGLMTTLTVGVLALADWAFGKWLEQSRFQLVAEVALALIIGFSITGVHKRIERFLNHVIFRAQAIAMAAIRRFTHEVDLIADPSQLLAQTLETLRSRLESQYVAIFTADGSTFVQSEPIVAGVPPLFSANDLAVLRLRRWSEPFECDVRNHALRGALMLPMAVRTQLVGFIACGPKADHTHYLPEEIETLQSLAHRAGAGYGWLTLRPVLPADVMPQRAT